jgi:hypothetical protein
MTCLSGNLNFTEISIHYPYLLLVDWFDCYWSQYETIVVYYGEFFVSFLVFVS